MNQKIEELIALSREFGSDERWVIAGGGNTSLKNEKHLFIKASGYPLATINEDGFVQMDRKKLERIWDTEYPSGSDFVSVAKREQMILQDMMKARVEAEERRPSVETLLHDLLPWSLIAHLPCQNDL